jgi:hypothetical protein
MISKQHHFLVTSHLGQQLSTLSEKKSWVVPRAGLGKMQNQKSIPYSNHNQVTPSVLACLLTSYPTACADQWREIKRI